MAHSIRREGFIQNNRNENLKDPYERRKENLIDTTSKRKESFIQNDARNNLINPREENKKVLNYDNFNYPLPNENGNTVFNSSKSMTSFGNTRMFSDGDIQTKMGDTYLSKNNITTKMNNTLISKNGITTKMNSTYFSPKGVYTVVGNSLIGPNGKVWSNIKDESEIESIIIHDNED